MAFIWFNPWSTPEASQPNPTGPRQALSGPAHDGPAPTTPPSPQPIATAPPAETTALVAAPGDAEAEPASAAVMPPSAETVQRYQQMQDSHHKAEDGYLQKFEDFIAKKKDQVFSLFHYIFGEGDKEPEKQADGTPKLETGGETAAQRTQRMAWEDAQHKALTAQQDQDNQAFLERARQEASQFDNPYDPTQNRRMYESYNRLQAEEDAMKRKQAESLSRLGIAGLPDPSVPGRTLTQFVDEGWGTYDRLVTANRNDENNSPEAIEINRYVNYVLDNPYRGWGGGMVA